MRFGLRMWTAGVNPRPVVVAAAASWVGGGVTWSCVEVLSGLGSEAGRHVLTASRFWFFWFSRERVQETLDTILLSGDPCQPLLSAGVWPQVQGSAPPTRGQAVTVGDGAYSPGRHLAIVNWAIHILEGMAGSKVLPADTSWPSPAASAEGEEFRLSRSRGSWGWGRAEPGGNRESQSPRTGPCAP